VQFLLLGFACDTALHCHTHWFARLLQDYTKPGALIAYFGLFAVHWVYFLIVQQLKRLKDRLLPIEALDKDAQDQALKVE